MLIDIVIHMISKQNYFLSGVWWFKGTRLLKKINFRFGMVKHLFLAQGIFSIV